MNLLIINVHGALFNRPSMSLLASSSSGAVSVNRKESTKGPVSVVTDTIGRFRHGVLDMIQNVKDANRIRQKKNVDGLASLKHSEFLKLERTWDDMMKLGRMAISYPLSPEFFFYVYIVNPILSSSSPWAWKALPSTFDTPENIIKCKDILKKRRVQAVISSIHLFKNTILEELNEERKEMNQNQLIIVEKAIQHIHSNIDKSLSELQPFYTSTKKTDEKSTLQLNDFPPGIIKVMCNCFGIDGVPNIPLLRMINKGELSKHMEMVR
eukprot:gene7480-15317_t